MLNQLVNRIVPDANARLLRGLHASVASINALEPELEPLSPEALRERFAELRERARADEPLDELLVPCFALVREAAKRALGQRHFDVQLMGGMTLHSGRIAEMKTGEGKTLSSTLAASLNALSGKGVHIVTVNDYLSRRDAEWMGQIYNLLGLSVGCIVPGLDDATRKAQYAADITYSTNSELGFDYLRDNMKYQTDEAVQRPYNFAIVDEVDSILIDEARTPLIISGPSDASSSLYVDVSRQIGGLKEQHYEKDEKRRSVTLTEEGVEEAESRLRKAGLLEETNGLYELQNVQLLHHVEQALRAHTLFERDVQYLVKDNQVFIVDEFTGRVLEGRRFSEGLHQALEAKEGVEIQRENQTLATITYQNFFRLYPKLSGMTGTALTEAAEFEEIYKLGVTEIPTHMEVVREDYEDQIFRTTAEKDAAILQQLRECQEAGQPVLVGTVSIERSEVLSALLRKEKIAHEVLNARSHQREALIIAQAGQPGAVTIATNMAGRGTDIQLGGNADMRIATEIGDEVTDNERKEREATIREEVEAAHKAVVESGGLFVLGTERHESRRIDNQLRGRSGRQGDPGTSKFYLSLEDDLLRIFASDRLDTVLRKLGLPEGEPIAHPWVSKALEKAQQKVEARNFEIRKTLLKYDDVMNEQRRIIYGQRHEVIDSEDLSEMVREFRETLYSTMPEEFLPEGRGEWNLSGLHEECRRLFALNIPLEEWEKEGLSADALAERIAEQHRAQTEEKEQTFSPELMRTVERQVLLNVVDRQWKDHLQTIRWFAGRYRLACLRATRPAQRVQARSLCLVLRNVRAHPRADGVFVVAC